MEVWHMDAWRRALSQLESRGASLTRGSVRIRQRQREQGETADAAATSSEGARAAPVILTTF
eukprot:1223448-Pleurochrysis_carterae.AAC.2